MHPQDKSHPDPAAEGIGSLKLTTASLTCTSCPILQVLVV